MSGKATTAGPTQMEDTMQSTMQLSFFAASRSMAGGPNNRRPAGKRPRKEEERTWKAIPLSGAEGVYYVHADAPGLAVTPAMGETESGWTVGEGWGVVKRNDGRVLVQPVHALEEAQRRALEMAGGKVTRRQGDKVRGGQGDKVTPVGYDRERHSDAGTQGEAAERVRTQMRVNEGEWKPVSELLAMTGAARELMAVGQYEGPQWSPFRPKRAGGMKDMELAQVMADRHDVKGWKMALALALVYCDRAPIGIWSEEDLHLLAIVHGQECWIL